MCIRDSVLAVAHDHFVYARARVTALPAADSIIDAIARTHATREALALLPRQRGVDDIPAPCVAVRDLAVEEADDRLAFIDRIGIDARGRTVATVTEAGEAWSFPVNTFT